MMLRNLPTFALLIAFLPAFSGLPVGISFAQPSDARIDAQFSGTCRLFDVVVEYEKEFSGCYDIKIDFPGRLVSPDQDSFFYAKEAFCESPTVMKIYADTAGNFTAVIKLRQGSNVVESEEFLVSQDCPSGNSGSALLYAAIVVVIMAAAIGMYIRK